MTEHLFGLDPEPLEPHEKPVNAQQPMTTGTNAMFTIPLVSSPGAGYTSGTTVLTQQAQALASMRLEEARARVDALMKPLPGSLYEGLTQEDVKRQLYAESLAELKQQLAALTGRSSTADILQTIYGTKARKGRRH